jgi:Cys-tRNA(Pro)/Cys-tRNA(Cys) deacylase
LGLKRKLPVFLDETALVFDTISVSAGKRGMQVLIGPRDLADAAGAEFRDLV